MHKTCKAFRCLKEAEVKSEFKRLSRWIFLAVMCNWFCFVQNKKETGEESNRWAQVIVCCYGNKVHCHFFSLSKTNKRERETASGIIFLTNTKTKLSLLCIQDISALLRKIIWVSTRKEVSEHLRRKKQWRTAGEMDERSEQVMFAAQVEALWKWDYSLFYAGDSCNQKKSKFLWSEVFLSDTPLVDNLLLCSTTRSEHLTGSCKTTWVDEWEWITDHVFQVHQWNLSGLLKIFHEDGGLHISSELGEIIARRSKLVMSSGCSWLA